VPSSSPSEPRRSRAPTSPANAPRLGRSQTLPVPANAVEPAGETRKDASPIQRSLRIALLAVDGMLLSNWGTVIDTLLIAQRVADLQMPGLLRFEGVLLGAGQRRSVRTADGTELQCRPTSEAGVVDLVLAPGLMHGSPRELIDSLPAHTREIEEIRRQHVAGARIASSCCGTFLLAESGLLDGRRATTSWWLGAAFAQRYPKVRLEPTAMLVEDEELITCGGGSGITDLLLRLIGAHGGEPLAQITARLRLHDPDRQSQAPFVSEALIERPRSSLGERAERVLQEAVQADWGVAELARRLGTSERSLLRHFHQHYGESPLAHLQRLRVERAKALLETSLLSFDEIVERCGYRDASSFRRLFKRATALTPAEYRERYRLRRH
jgi:transcriptional regulator GlxA family with amidase domain